MKRPVGCFILQQEPQFQNSSFLPHFFINVLFQSSCCSLVNSSFWNIKHESLSVLWNHIILGQNKTGISAKADKTKSCLIHRIRERHRKDNCQLTWSIVCPEKKAVIVVARDGHATFFCLCVAACLSACSLFCPCKMDRPFKLSLPLLFFSTADPLHRSLDSASHCCFSVPLFLWLYLNLLLHIKRLH